jgi:hypothetical protein
LQEANKGENDMLTLIFGIATFCLGMYIAENNAKGTIENLSNYIEKLEEEKRQQHF